MLKIVFDENIPYVASMFSHIAHITTVDGRNINLNTIEGSDALIVRSTTKVGRSLIEPLKKPPKFIGSCTAGIDHIDQDYLQKKGIHFSYAPGCNARSVAEYVLCGLSVLITKKSYQWSDLTIGIVGFGQVGSLLYKLLTALDFSVMIYDPFCHKNPGINFTDLNHLLTTCNVISLHTPLTYNSHYPTHHLITQEQLTLLAHGSILINTSRGGVINNLALLEFLKIRTDVSVILDVWENEPNINTELLSLIDIATPHIAGYSLDSKVKALQAMYQNIHQFFNLPYQLPPIISLPKNGIHTLELTSDFSIQKKVSLLIKNVYDILEDNLAMQSLTKLTATKQSQLFDNMRKYYPLRREFNSLTVNIKHNDHKLTSILKILGLNIANS